MAKKIRLDQLILQKGLVQSREKAKAMIMAGCAEVDGIKADKPGRLVSPLASVVLKNRALPYVSRGGLKLEAALEHFPVKIEGKTIIDVGASTGGFTDCLLKYGAKRVIAVDVGYGQFAWKLRQNQQVRLLERTNIRYLKSKDINETIEGAVIDVSFISLCLVVPPVSDLLTQQSFIIALIKPQFEVGKGKVGKGGVVRDKKQHTEVIDKLTTFFKGIGWKPQGCIPSPILGPKGNREFMIYLVR